jgi:hypothetical protein
MVDETVSRVFIEVGSDSDGTPSTESYSSQEVAVPASRELQPASQVVAHAPLEPGSPIAFDVLDAVEDDGDVVIARTCCPTVEGDEGIAQLARRRRPPRRGTQSRRGRQNAVQRCQMLGRLTNCAETTHQKGHDHTPGSNVRPLNHQLESGSVGAQDQVLAAAGVDEDVLEARECRDQDTVVLDARRPNGLSDGWKD